MLRFDPKAKLKLLVKENPKRGASRERFEKGYRGARTVAKALANGIWIADLSWDFERGFIEIGGESRPLRLRGTRPTAKATAKADAAKAAKAAKAKARRAARKAERIAAAADAEVEVEDVPLVTE